MSKVVLCENKNAITYPDRSTYYSPSVSYPEYRWDDCVSDKPNLVYELIRETLHLAGLDKANFGSPSWNPLSEYIKPGQTVLLKPNWVENKNPVTDDNLACLVTNPSVVRPIIDYVLIALNGRGKIILADAPMQGCDLDEVFNIAGYNELFQFYEIRNVKLEIADMRKYSVKTVYDGVFAKPVLTENSKGSVVVNLGSRSIHAEKDDLNPLYKVEDYPQTLTANYHSKGKHQYEVNALPICADVIINLPKPKTHRLAGITAACKNFVGITYEKACLPHRIDGDKETGAGDAYYKHSLIKSKMSYFNEKRTYHSRNGEYFKAKLNDILMKVCYVVGLLTSGDKYRIGSWYGNDTVWRTVVDLNNILIHTDKNGDYIQSQKKVVLHFGDMIIGGQKDGPVKPIPKPLGIVLFSDNAMLFDRVVCEIMGFSVDALPMFNHTGALNVFGYKGGEDLDNERIISNNSNLNNCSIKDFPDIEKWHFEPHTSWKGHIEKQFD